MTLLTYKPQQKMSRQLLLSGENQREPRPIQKAFYTDLNEKSEIQEQQGRLRKYVDQIDRKIDYAKWKQDLVLKYNYMPIKRITEKAQSQKFNYLKKINQEQQLSAKMLSGKEITVQLDLFREFSKHLNQKQQQLKVKIAAEKDKNDVLLKDVEIKRSRLKEKMKENMQAIKQSLQEKGITSKQDIISLFRSKSMKDKFTPSSLTSRSQAARKVSERKVSTQSSKRKNSPKNLKLFQDCLNQLILLSNSSKISETVQSEIYLNKVQKIEHNSKTLQQQSTKNQILETLNSKSGISLKESIKIGEKRETFKMDWNNFKHLDSKNMLSLILGKQVYLQKLKKLLKYK